MKNNAPLVSKDTLLPFILLTICFAAWGVAANMTDPLVKVFSKIFTMSSLQSALVQFAYYGIIWVDYDQRLRSLICGF